MYDYNNYLTTTSTVSSMNGPIVWTIISGVIAIIGGFVAYFLFVKSDKKLTNNFLNKLKDFADFKTMLIEPMLKISYLVLAIYLTLFSLCLIGNNFAGFLITLIAGNFILRIVYEASLILLGIWKNTNEINKKIK